MRKAAVAGAFYPTSVVEIKEMLAEFMENVPEQKIDGELKAVIVPHAGWIYSGQVAAYAYDLVKKSGKKKIVLIGPSHNVYMDEVAADQNEEWETPLGKVKIMENKFPKMEEAHAMEHCLEVQVPFLQFLLKDFEILPLLAGAIEYKRVAELLKEVLDDDTLLIISSDLSHFYTYENANKLDEGTNKAILDLDPEKVGEACGKIPIQAVIELAKELGWRVKHLIYKNSGDITEDKHRVVGYSSFAFSK